MSETHTQIVEHYAKSGLLERLQAALKSDGADPMHPTLESLAPYDHFHGRGLEATEEMAALVEVEATDHLLDVGSGLGGPARWFARHRGCRVTGIDLTPEYCTIAQHFTRLLGMESRVQFQVGNALSLPFADATFDGAYSMFVSMNIEDKARFHRELYRVLKPGGWLVLSEIARGEAGEIAYPMPWAPTAAESFLATLSDTRRDLQCAGFEVEQVINGLQRALEFGVRAKTLIERGEKPPFRANRVIHGEIAAATLVNIARAYQDGTLVPVEVVARKI